MGKKGKKGGGKKSGKGKKGKSKEPEITFQEAILAYRWVHSDLIPWCKIETIMNTALLSAGDYKVDLLWL